MAITGRRRAVVEGTAAGFLFGTAAILIRLVDIGSFSLAFWRLIIASGLLLPVVLVYRKRFSIKWSKNGFKDFLVLGLLLGVHFILFVDAVKNTSILNATVLVNTAPIFSMAISTVLYRSRPSKMVSFGIMLSFVGAIFMVHRDAEIGKPANLLGDLEAAFAALAEGFYLNYGRVRRKQFSLIPTMLFIYLAAAFTVAIMAVVAGTTLKPIASWEMLLPLASLGILPTAVAHTLYFSSLSNLKSFETATMALLEPIGATILGIAMFAEIPAPIFVVGTVLVLLGIFAVVAGKQPIRLRIRTT